MADHRGTARGLPIQLSTLFRAAIFGIFFLFCIFVFLFFFYSPPSPLPGPPFLETKTAGAEMQDPGEERASTPLGISQVKRQLVVGGKGSTWRLTSTFRPDLWSLEAATEFRGHLQWD